MTQTSKRDDFPEKVKRAMAARAGYVCSFPGCIQPTSGPSDESPSASVNVGEACHIKAAASGPGARRIDPSMTSSERKSIDNGIWMCRNHAKLIDSDEARHTVEQLRKWRREAEARAEKRLRAGSARNGVDVSTPAVDEDRLPPNPFGNLLAIRDEAAFIGRERELRRLRDMLAGGSVALWGEPKIGKSSLLLRVAATWDEEATLGPVDFEAIEDRDDFYAALAGELGMASGGWREIRGQLAGRDALLILDELDKAPACGWKAEDLGLLRSLCGRNPRLKVLAASRKPPKEIFPDLGEGSPVFNFLQPQRLTDLEQADAKVLLTHPWAPAAPDFDATTTAELLATAGSRPFRLQRVAFQRYQAFADPDYDWRTAWREDLELLL